MASIVKLFLKACLVAMIILVNGHDPLIASDKEQYTGPHQRRDQINRHYGYVYWENGSPQKKISRRPKSWVNPEMAMNPDIVFQTGFYDIRFETDTFQFSGYQASRGSNYLAALTEDVWFLPGRSAQLVLTVKLAQSGETIEYSAKTAVVEANEKLNVRLIENGQYVQRIDHTGIIFQNDQGETLPEAGYFEITSWPNKVVLTLDFSHSSLPIVESTIKLISPYGNVHVQKSNASKTNLVISPQTDSTLSRPNAFVSQAYEKHSNLPVNIEFDDDYHAFRIDMPVISDKDLYGVDEFIFEIDNPDSTFANIPIVFNRTGSFKWITGTVMTLTGMDGRPTGIPVQVSKNWHKNYPDKHAGSWIRGSSMIPVDGNSTRKFILKVVHGYWDQVATASHSQLSLVGWKNYSWKWDESALGAWGESMTFDPGQTVAGAFMADIRPTFTTPTNGNSDHAWTENLGGGDFLKYFDGDKRYRWAKKLKTAYHWTGPNMTEVLYSGISDNESIRFVYKTQLVRSNDYHRRFNHFRYEFLKDIEPKRLVFYQMAADYYMLPQFITAYWGNETTSNSLTPFQGGNVYTDKIPINNRWIAIEDLVTSKVSAKSNRGIIWRKSRLNERDFDLYAHVYGRTWGRSSSLFDFSGVSTAQKYEAGNVIEGEIEYVMPAKSDQFYWGNDKHFSKRLSQSSKPWELVQQEFVYNNFDLSISGGNVLNDYPIDIEPSGKKLDLQIVIPGSKGVGHLPIIVRNVNAGKTIHAYIFSEGSWIPAAEKFQNFSSHSYYQAYFNAQGKKDYVFNISRPDSHPFEESLRIRFCENSLFN